MEPFFKYCFFFQSVLQATGSRPHDGAELLSSLHGANLAVPNSFTKRQGVSGESSDAKHRAGAIDTAAAAPVVRFEKDFRYCAIDFSTHPKIEDVFKKKLKYINLLHEFLIFRGSEEKKLRY